MKLATILIRSIGPIACLGASLCSCAHGQTVPRNAAPTEVDGGEVVVSQAERQLTGEELKIVLSDVIIKHNSNISEYFYRDGRYFITVEHPQWGTFIVTDDRVCVTVYKTKEHCSKFYVDGNGNYYTSESSKKSNKRFPVTISPSARNFEDPSRVASVSNSEVSIRKQLLNPELTNLLSDVAMNTGSTVEHKFYKNGRYFIDAEVSSESHFFIVHNMVCIGSSESTNCLKIYKTGDGKYYASWSGNTSNKTFEVRFRPIKD